MTQNNPNIKNYILGKESIITSRSQLPNLLSKKKKKGRYRKYIQFWEVQTCVQIWSLHPFKSTSWALSWCHFGQRCACGKKKMSGGPNRLSLAEVAGLECGIWRTLGDRCGWTEKMNKIVINNVSSGKQLRGNSLRNGCAVCLPELESLAFHQRICMTYLTSGPPRLSPPTDLYSYDKL